MFSTLIDNLRLVVAMPFYTFWSLSPFTQIAILIAFGFTGATLIVIEMERTARKRRHPDAGEGWWTSERGLRR